MTPATGSASPTPALPKVVAMGRCRSSDEKPISRLLALFRVFGWTLPPSVSESQSVLTVEMPSVSPLTFP